MNNPWETIQVPKQAINVKLVSAKHPLRLFWGRSPTGNYLFVIDFDFKEIPKKNTLPKLAGITFHTHQNHSDAKLIIFLKDVQNWELFNALCVDLIHASSEACNHISGLKIIIQRLFRWHELLKSERTNTLSESKIKGLIGELLLLKNDLAPQFGWEQSIVFWKGPTGAPQDFAVHSSAIEVKCQSGVSKPSVKISSLEQLESALSELYLVVYTLTTAEEIDSNSFTLNSLIENIKKSLVEANDFTQNLFESLLFQIGYACDEEYSKIHYKFITRKIFRVTEKFPFLTTHMVPEGVISASYHISLAACTSFEQNNFSFIGEKNDN